MRNPNTNDEAMRIKFGEVMPFSFLNYFFQVLYDSVKIPACLN